MASVEPARLPTANTWKEETGSLQLERGRRLVGEQSLGQRAARGWGSVSEDSGPELTVGCRKAGVPLTVLPPVLYVSVLLTR